MDSYGGSMDSMGNNGGSMVGRSMGNWSMVGCWGSVIMRLSLVGHISNVTIIVVGVVGDVLDSAVRKVDRVGSSNNTVTVIVLLLLESSSAVIISNSVGVLVRRGLGQIVSNVSGLHGGVVSRGGGVVGGGGVDHGSGGVVGWGSVDNWGVVDSVVSHGVNSVMNRGDDSMVSHGVDCVMDWSVDSVVKRGVVDGVMSNNSISSVKSVGGISNDGSVSSEGLALCGGPVLSLVRFAH